MSDYEAAPKLRADDDHDVWSVQLDVRITPGNSTVKEMAEWIAGLVEQRLNCGEPEPFVHVRSVSLPGSCTAFNRRKG